MLAIALFSKSPSDLALGWRCFGPRAERCQNAGSQFQPGLAGTGALAPFTLPGAAMGRRCPSMQCLQPPPMGRCSLPAPGGCQPTEQLCTGHRPPATATCLLVGVCQGDAAKGCDKGDAISMSPAYGWQLSWQPRWHPTGSFAVRLCRPSSLSLAASPSLCIWGFPLALNGSCYQEENREGEDERLILMLLCYL